MKINGDISGVAFSHDGSKVFANSGECVMFRASVTSQLYVLSVR